ncbi:CSN-associated deubiquitinating enzyme Ubp12 [Chytriomyces hyalinus]|nr:CSN-associated deubiquitinating enzyme Ubp12 [Chytriomyces hyalinus]
MAAFVFERGSIACAVGVARNRGSGVDSVDGAAAAQANGISGANGYAGERGAEHPAAHTDKLSLSTNATHKSTATSSDSSSPFPQLQAQMALVNEVHSLSAGPPIVGDSYESHRLSDPCVEALPAHLRLLSPVIAPNSSKPSLSMLWLLAPCQLLVRIHPNLDTSQDFPCPIRISQHSRLSHLMSALNADSAQIFLLACIQVFETINPSLDDPTPFSAFFDSAFLNLPLHTIQSQYFENSDPLVFELLQLDEELVSSASEKPNDAPFVVPVSLYMSQSPDLPIPDTVPNSPSLTVPATAVSAVSKNGNSTSVVSDPINQNSLEKAAHAFASGGNEFGSRACDEPNQKQAPEKQMSSTSTIFDNALDTAETQVSASSITSSPKLNSQESADIHNPDKEPLGICGLKNLGNTCYMNSALQCLLQTRPLISYFLRTHEQLNESIGLKCAPFPESQPSKPGGNADLWTQNLPMAWHRDLNLANPLGSKGGVVKTFSRFVETVYGVSDHPTGSSSIGVLNSAGNGSSRSSVSTLEKDSMVQRGQRGFGRETVNPRVLKKAVSLFNDCFAGSEQQDAQEFLQVILDALHEDLKKRAENGAFAAEEVDRMDEDPSGGAKAANPAGGSTNSLRSAAAEPCLPEVTSPIAEIFQGSLKSNIECMECHASSIKAEPFVLLSLPVSNGPDDPECSQGAEVIISIVNSRNFPGTRVKVRVHPQWTIFDLKKNVAKAFAADHQWPVEALADLRKRVIVYKVDYGRIQKIFRDYESAMDVSTSHVLGRLSGLFISELETPSLGNQILCAGGELKASSYSGREAGVAHVPVYFSGSRKLFIPPLILPLPAQIYVTCQFQENLLQFFDPVQVRLAKRLAYRQAFGKALYNVIFDQLLNSYEMEWMFKKRTDDELTFEVFQAAVEELLLGNPKRCQELIDTNRLFRSIGSASDLVPIENLFTIKWYQGEATRAPVWERDEFYNGTLLRKNPTVLYPVELHEFAVDHENPHLMGFLDDVEVSDPEHLQFLSHDADVGELTNRTERFAMDGESLFLLHFPQPIKEFMSSLADFSPAYNHDSLEGYVYPPPLKEYALETCLREFLREELLGKDDTWFCPTCKDQRQIKKRLDVQSLPEVLIFHFKRFSTSYQGFENSLSAKIEGLVRFPISGLDMSDIVNRGRGERTADGSNEALKQEVEPGEILETSQQDSCAPCQNDTKRASPEQDLYDLYAVSNHFGGLNGGHYTAFVKSVTQNEWFHMDDSKVSPIHEDDIVVSHFEDLQRTNSHSHSVFS